MNQVVKDKMKREIMVVKNTKLFWKKEKESRFYDNNEVDFEKKILKHYKYMVRGEAEVNFEYKQPIGYAVVLNEDNKIFVYKRWGAGSNAWDARLHSKIAFWVGGHIEKEEQNSKNPIADSLVREVEEELNIKEKDIESVEAIWYINDEENEVGKVHIWIAYVVKVSHSNVELLDWELDNWEFVTMWTLEWMIISWNYDVEAWSQILFEPLRNYLK